MQSIEKSKGSSGDGKLAGISNDPICPALNGKALKVVNNCYQPRCSLLLSNHEGSKKIRDLLAASIQKAVLVAGFRSNAESDTDQRRQNVIEMIKVAKRHSWLSYADLETIIDWGLAGDFDTENNKSFALNARTLNTWIKTYYEQERQSAMKIQNYYMQTIEHEKEEVQRKKAYEESKVKNKEMLAGCYKILQEDLKGQNVRETDIPSDMDELCLAMYYQFEKSGLLDINKEQRNAMYHEELEKLIDTPQPLADLRVKKYCRIRTVKQHLTKLLNNGTDIEVYLNRQVK